MPWSRTAHDYFLLRKSASAFAAQRGWLIDVLVSGESVESLLPGPFSGPKEAISAAEREQVLGLICQRMRSLPAHHPWCLQFRAKERELVAQSLMRAEQCRRVLETLLSAGLSPLILKGGAFAYWLYPQPWLRHVVDIDLLFRDSEDAAVALKVLQGIGYSGGYVGNEAFETACRRPGALEIDIHWGLVNSSLFARQIPFCEFEARAICLPLLSKAALALSPVDSLIHSCVHRVMNVHMGTGDALKWLYDIHLLVLMMSDLDWELLVARCRERQLTVVCLDGLEVALKCFGTQVPDEVMISLARAARYELLDQRLLHQWRYIQFMTFVELPTWSERLSWLYRKFFPSIAYLSSVYGQRLGTLGLWVERVRRFSLRIR